MYLRCISSRQTEVTLKILLLKYIHFGKYLHQYSLKNWQILYLKLSLHLQVDQLSVLVTSSFDELWYVCCDSLCEKVIILMCVA